MPMREREANTSSLSYEKTRKTGFRCQLWRGWRKRGHAWTGHFPYKFAAFKPDFTLDETLHAHFSLLERLVLLPFTPAPDHEHDYALEPRPTFFRSALSENPRSTSFEVSISTVHNCRSGQRGAKARR